MGYPDYPRNRLIVNGIDLTEKFKMVLLDGYELKPPEPKVYTVDIPGGNGVINLTGSLSGDVSYSNREQNFEFKIINVKHFEKIKTDIINLLHGKSYDYIMTMDKGYTYHGMFKVEECSHQAYSNGLVATIKINISANPYKIKHYVTKEIQADGGVLIPLESGRLRVKPVIVTKRDCVIIFDGIRYDIVSAGTWALDKVIFKYGLNNFYVRTNKILNTTFGYFEQNNMKFSDIASKRIFEWYKLNYNPTDVPETSKIIVKYDWGDL